MRNVSSKSQPDYKLKILVLQTVTVGLILALGVVLRMFGGDAYKSVSVWYHEKFDDITLTSEVLTPDNPTDSQENNTTDEQTQDTSSAESEEQQEFDSELDDEITGNITDLESVKSTVAVNSYNTFQWPLIGTITSHYGYRKNPITGNYANHNGLDIAANSGTDIVAAYGGEVAKTGYSSSYGYYVIIDHGGSVQTLYAHCSKVVATMGQTVQKGDTVALVGSTGRSTGPHLHFEVRVNGYRLDPEWLLSELRDV